jgi:hypothetical protein
MTASLPALQIQASLHTAYSHHLKRFLLPNSKPGKIATQPASLVAGQRSTWRNKMAMMILFRKIARCGMIGRRNR